MPHFGGQGARRGLLHHLAAVHDVDTVGPASHHAEVMADQDDRHAPFPADVAAGG